MCRKLLCLVAMLGIVSVASAVPPLPVGTVTVIDDFESYWGTPAMVTPTGPWSGSGLPGTIDVLQLITAGGSAQGAQHMRWDWTNLGGWALPGDPTNYDPMSNHTMMGTTMPAYNITNSSTQMTLMHMSLQIPAGAGTPPGEYLLEYGGDQYSQTWIPSKDCGAQWWIPATAIPAKVWDDGWGYDPYVPGNNDYSGVPNLAVGGMVNGVQGPLWLDITVNPDMWVTWGAPLVDFDDMNSLNYAAFGNGPPDTSGASGASKVSGTDTVWPPGPISGTLLVDNIWFEEVIPEPTTIALLGLGGLALIRRKR